MDVYSQNQQRAHGTGFVGIEAESDDAIDALEVYEATINPREAGNSGGGAGGPGMMPPMMGMMGGGGAGGAAGGAASLGASQGMTGAAAASTAARLGAPPLTAAPQAAPAAAGAGVGSSLPSLGGGGVVGGGALAAGAPGAALDDTATDDAAIDGSGQIAPHKDSDVVEVDPARVEQVAKEWTDLSERMHEVSSISTELQASLEDFGLVSPPAGPYETMTSDISRLAGGASREFQEIASGLARGAQNYRDNEAAAADTIKRAR